MVTEMLMAAWSQISTQFSAGLNVHVATSGGADVAHNATGGIYGKGAFLTTFAEDGPEAAIPLDGSNNALSLWQKAGEILGVLPGKEQSDKGNKSESIFSRIPSIPPVLSDMDNGASEGLLPSLLRQISASIPFSWPGVGGINVEDILPSLPPILPTQMDDEKKSVLEVSRETTDSSLPLHRNYGGGGSTNTIEINMPAITINGNADAGTVTQLEGLMDQMKADLMREVRKQFPGMVASNDHRERRLSYAT